MKRNSSLSTCLVIVLISALHREPSWHMGCSMSSPDRRKSLSGRPEIIFPRDKGSISLPFCCSSKNNLRKFGDPQGDELRFEINIGESTLSITERLQSLGFIIDARAFRDYLLYSGLDASIQAGEYNLSSRMSSLEIAHILQDATPGEVTFTILAGWRLEEIAAALPTSGLEFSPRAFETSAANPPPVSPLVAELPTGASLEGFLYPDSYLLPRQISVDGFIRTLLEDFQVKVNDEILDGYQRHGLDIYQGVTLASIVEREAVIEDEMPLIASVFHNRLDAGMKLDSDPTVQYALGFNSEQDTWWTNPLSLADLQVNSPYNTYIAMGLPPGPIANPSLAAIKAVAFPAQTPYYYFRSACDGSGRHSFAETFEEHKLNQCPDEGD